MFPSVRPDYVSHLIGSQRRPQRISVVSFFFLRLFNAASLFFRGFLQMDFDEILPPHCSTVAFVCGSIVFADNGTRSNRKWRPDSCNCQTSGERFVVNLHHFNLVVSPSRARQ